MTKSDIEKMLRDEKMIHQIAVLRTHCSHHITYDNFFYIFICSFYRIYNINMSTHIETYESNDIIPYCTITFSDQLHESTFIFYLSKVNDKLKEYNERLETMSFKESAIFLIDIFLEILEE